MCYVGVSMVCEDGVYGFVGDVVLCIFVDGVEVVVLYWVVVVVEFEVVVYWFEVFGF